MNLCNIVAISAPGLIYTRFYYNKIELISRPLEAKGCLQLSSYKVGLFVRCFICRHNEIKVYSGNISAIDEWMQYLQDDCFVSINLNGVGLFIKESADCCL